MAAPHPLPERPLDLWMLAAPPVVWAAHFLMCYVTAAIWCARVAGQEGMLGGVRTAVAVYTVAAVAAIAFVGWRGLRHHTLGTSTLSHAFDSPEDRHRFLGFATLLLAGLSAVATIFVGLGAAFIESCR